MRTWYPRHRSMSVLAGFLLVSALSGMPPQEGRAASVPVAGAGERGGQATVSQAPALSPRSQGRSGPIQRNVGFAPARVSRVYLYPGTRTVVPPGWDRCTTMPGPNFWEQRDIFQEIRWLSRSGFIPVSPIGDTVDVLSDYSQWPAGWRAYGISVPAGGTLQVEVQHTKLGWFRLLLVDKWGVPGPGMLQAAYAYRPVMVTYKNPGKEATAVYVIVDDPGWWSDAKDPYTLQVRRDWDPAKTDLSQVKMVTGLWGASPSVSAQFRGPSLTGPAVFPH